MRIPGQNRHRTALSSEAMTPMIDVVFLLLVFFVCASAGQVPDSLLPARLAAGASEVVTEVPPETPDDPEHQIVRVSLRPGTATDSLDMRLNGRPVSSEDDLRDRLTRLAKIDPQTRIILDIDDAVSVQDFISIYELCRRLDFESISFGVRP